MTEPVIAKIRRCRNLDPDLVDELLAEWDARERHFHRLVRHLGRIAEECVAARTDAIENIYHECYLALVGDLALPAETQRDRMQAIIYLTTGKEAPCPK